MDVREKLVGLIFGSLCRHIHKSCKLAENIADDLIANGVTVQEERRWIPVTERLPQNYISVLVYLPEKSPLPTVHEAYIGGDGEWHSPGIYGVENENVTHWMSMPEPLGLENPFCCVGKRKDCDANA